MTRKRDAKEPDQEPAFKVARLQQPFGSSSGNGTATSPGGFSALNATINHKPTSASSSTSAASSQPRLPPTSQILSSSSPSPSNNYNNNSQGNRSLSGFTNINGSWQKYPGRPSDSFSGASPLSAILHTTAPTSNPQGPPRGQSPEAVSRERKYVVIDTNLFPRIQVMARPATQRQETAFAWQKPATDAKAKRRNATVHFHAIHVSSIV